MSRSESKYDLVVLGGGPAGVLTALAAVDAGATVALVERHLLGGTCLYTGCIPSKAILRTSRLYAEMRDAERYGARVPGDVRVDFRLAMDRMRRIRARIAREFSADVLRAAGIDVRAGEGRFDGPATVVVNGEVLRFSRAVVATGSRPLISPVPGLREAGFLTTDNVFDLDECPRRLLVLGGGPLGCELAQAYGRLGAHVIIAQSEPMFLRQEERDAAQILSDALARDGIEIHLNTDVMSIRVQDGVKVADLACDDVRSTVPVDEILLGTGRAPNVERIGLEAAGVEYHLTKGVVVDDFLRTTNPSIYATGDVWAEHRFTHIEGASSRIVVENALHNRRLRLSDLAIPWCTYTDPEIAHIGVYVRDAREQGIPVKTFTVPMHAVHRAVADSEDEGFVKIHVREGTDEILGATVVARHAGEMTNDIALAMVSKTGLRAIANVIHAYPTQAAAIKMAAEACCREQSAPIRRSLARLWMKVRMRAATPRHAATAQE